jgi:hypothetical protein
MLTEVGQANGQGAGTELASEQQRRVERGSSGQAPGGRTGEAPPGSESRAASRGRAMRATGCTRHRPGEDADSAGTTMCAALFRAAQSIHSSVSSSKQRLPCATGV